MNSASLCSLAGRYENPIPPRCLAPIDFLKIPAQLVGCWYKPRRHKTKIVLAVKQDTPEPASKTLQASSCTIGLVMENPEKEKSGKIRKWAKMNRQGKWVSLLLFSTPQRPEARVLILIGILPSLAGRERREEADFYDDESCKSRAVSAALTKGCSASSRLMALVHNSTSSLISR
jgi:hypothetical protein